MVGTLVPNFHYVPHFRVPVNFPDQCCAFFFFFFPVVSGLSCGTWYLHRLIQNLSLQRRDSSCVARAPEHTGSAVTAHGLSCSMAYGILVPLHCKADS